jgi:hypothetical protein
MKKLLIFCAFATAAFGVNTPNGQFPYNPNTGNAGAALNFTTGQLTINGNSLDTLASDLTYIPLTDASNTFTAAQTVPSLAIDGAAGLGFISLPSQSSAPASLSGNIRLYSDLNNKLAWIGASGFVRSFDGTITANRSYSLPDVSGNVVVDDATQTLTNKSIAASEITSGTLSSSLLPTPTTSALGGIEAINAVSHQWISYIDASGIPHLAQPAFTDISGSVASTQMPALTGDVTMSAGSTTTTVGHVNGVSYGTAPSTNTVPVVTAANNITYEAVPNAALAYSSITIAGTSTALGSSITLDTITGLSTTGLVKRTGANTLAIATAGTDYAPAAGDSSIATVGTVTAGTWQGTAISGSYLAGPHNFTSLTSGALLVGAGTSPITASAVSLSGNAITALNSVTAAASTDFTAFGGSSGAELDLGNGTNGAVSITPAGTGGFTVTMANGSARPGNIINNGSGQGVLNFENTNSAGYSEIDFLNNSAVSEAFIGFANSGASFDPSKFYALGRSGVTMVIGGAQDSQITLTGSSVTFDSSSPTTFQATTTSTSTTTGAVIVDGGLGVFGNINDGGSVTISSSSSGSGVLYLNQSANSHAAQIVFQTGGSTNWYVGMNADETGNYEISNSSGGLVWFVTNSTNQIQIGSSSSASAWGANGIQEWHQGKTYTDSSTGASSTASLETFTSFSSPTLSATNTGVTTTTAATVYVAGAPIPGTNQTITNPYALDIASGASFFGGNVLINGSLSLGSPEIIKTYLTSGLPSASANTFGLAAVSDSTSSPGTNIGSAPTGGGSYFRIVYSTGSSWLQL